MSDIIADINKKIQDAEKARDSAIAEVQKIKETISKNHIVLYEEKAYMFVGDGVYNGYNCTKCPFVEWTSADSYKCSMHRDAGRCADSGGRYYPVSEIKNNFKKQLKNNSEIECLKYKLDEAVRWLNEISKTSAKYAASVKDE